MTYVLCCLAFFLSGYQKAATTSGATYTLTIHVESVNQDKGNIGVLVFKSSHGWPENRAEALKDIIVPAQSGTVTVIVPDLAPGDYAVAHDVNRNHKLDKSFFGVPKEQWGMSNNPHATVKAPPFSAAKFSVTNDMEIHVRMQ